MGSKKFIFISLLILAIGFAAVTTTLYITGNVAISTKKNNFDVYFSGAEIDNVDVSNLVIKDKKHIEYTANELKSLNDTSVLKYEVTNDSTEYDATVTISCTPMKTNYMEVTLTPVTFDIDAGEIKSGEIEAKLTSVSKTEQTIDIDCELSVSAKEKTTIADYVPKENYYALSGQLKDTNGNPLGNKYLVAYSNKTIITTDSNGNFNVNGLDRGIHHLYYLDNVDPRSLNEEQVIENAKDVVEFSTNQDEATINFSKYELSNVNLKKLNYYRRTITFNTVTGTIYDGEETKAGFYGEPIGFMPTPVKNKATFLGWYYNGKRYTESSILDVDEDIMLVAKYKYQELYVTNAELAYAGKFVNVEPIYEYNQLNGTDGVTIVGNAPNNTPTSVSGCNWGLWSDGKRWDFETDLTSLKYLTFSFKKNINHGSMRVMITDGLKNATDCPTNKTVQYKFKYNNQWVSELYAWYNQINSNTWYTYTVDISSITGNHVVSFIGGYPDSSGFPESSTTYSNIRFY